MNETLAALDKIARAEQAVDDLCSGRLRWEMRVPAEPDHDPDLIISDALRAARETLTARGVRVGYEGLRAARPCARYFGSDGTLCASHSGRFRSSSEVRCDRAALAATPTPPEIDVLRAEIERLCVSWQTAVPVDVLRSVLEAKS